MMLWHMQPCWLQKEQQWLQNVQCLEHLQFMSIHWMLALFVKQEDRYQLIYGFRSSEGVIEKVSELINSADLKEPISSVAENAG